MQTEPAKSVDFYAEKPLPVEEWERGGSGLLDPQGSLQLLFQYVVLSLQGSAGLFRELASNRIALLHGPPGTGKTTAGRAVASRCARYLGRSSRATCLFMELHVEGIFSRWLGETPQRMAEFFGRVHECLRDGARVIVFLDDAESILANRGLSLNGSNPIDILTSGNVLLRELDSLRSAKGVAVLATTNFAGAIDPAVLGRVDLAVNFSLPDLEACRDILWNVACNLSEHVAGFDLPPATIEEVAQRCVEAGLSGREIRKLFLVAVARANGSMSYDRALLDAVERVSSFKANGNTNSRKAQ